MTSENSEQGAQTVPVGFGRVTVGDGVDEIVVRSPYDDTVVGRVPSCTRDHVAQAVAAAKSVLAGDGTSSGQGGQGGQGGGRGGHHPLPPHERAAILDRAALALADRQEELARTIAAEAAKPIRTARIEAARAVDTFRFSAAEARTLAGDVVPVDASSAGVGKLAFTLRVPIGVVGAISPFNFPLNLVAHKLAPAIAAGCPVVLKPASQTPLSAIKLAHLLLDDCGLPAGWLSVVTGGGGTVGDALVEHPDVAMITFTGSPPVGWGIRARAPQKKVSLELGNNSPVIVEADGDWEAAVAKIRVAGFSHAGQSCISTQRVYVNTLLFDRFVEKLADEVATLVVGAPLDDATEVSALISHGETERVRSWIDDAVAGGARIVAGGKVDDRGVLQPTVLADVTPDMKVCSDEVFGPVVAVAAYHDFDEALALANDTRYGLQAAVFTGRLDRALQAARTLDYGGVLVNEVPTWRADQQPYGGVRNSGNTREGPHYAVREMTEERLVVLS